MVVGERAFQHGGGVAALAEAQLVAKLFGRAVEFVDVVVAVVEEIAHLLVGQLRLGRLWRLQREVLVERLEALVERAVGAMQGEELARQVGRRGRGELDLRDRRRLGAEGEVGARLAQVGDEPALVVGVELGGIDAEGARQGDQYARRDRSLVGLDLREVARRERQATGAQLQRLAFALAQGPDLRAYEEFVARTSQFCKNPVCKREFLCILASYTAPRHVRFCKA
ncbi:MAG: hypothetical protein U1F11_14070 [Steroidobacteraceae bacterium]